MFPPTTYCQDSVVMTACYLYMLTGRLKGIYKPHKTIITKSIGCSKLRSSSFYQFPVFMVEQLQQYLPRNPSRRVCVVCYRFKRNISECITLLRPVRLAYPASAVLPFLRVCAAVVSCVLQRSSQPCFHRPTLRGKQKTLSLTSLIYEI